MIRNTTNKPIYHSITIYLFMFLMLWQWVSPLKIVTDTGSIHFFIIYIAICLFLYFFNVKFIFSLLIKAASIFIILHQIFIKTSITNLAWILTIINEIEENIGKVFRFSVFELSNLFRSFLFFVLISVVLYLIHYFCIKQQRIFLFVVITVVYIGILDTFTKYEGKWSIILVLAASYFVMGTNRVMKLLEDDTSNKKNILWIIPLISSLLISVSFGYFFPKPKPQWPDPVPYIKAYLPANLGGVKKIGYGTNDTTLGGPFIQDDDVVFTVKVDEPHYWKVETKTTYTGKGWINADGNSKMLMNSREIWMDDFESGVELKNVDASIKLEDETVTPHIIYSNDLSAISSRELENRKSILFFNSIKESISLQQDNDVIPLTNYSISYKRPEFFLPYLKSIKYSHAPGIYTKLPEAFPERVADLAQKITENETNIYDKAKAIEQFLSNGEYVYETINVAVPKEDEDYVEQFLFNTKKGYCDNFSTSMVVLLRSLDIPAKWVKGYSAGELQRVDENGKRVYELQNANAHSWVEVYFEGIGWVPFEPTPGFLGNATFKDREKQANLPVPLPKEDKKEVEKKEQEKKKTNDNFGYGMNVFKKYWYAIFTPMIIMALLLWVFRKKLFLLYIHKKFATRKDEQALMDAYNVLVKQLRKKGLPFESGMTHRQFAKIVDQRLGTDEMMRFSLAYELVVFGDGDSEVLWNKNKELWDNLIRQICS